MSEREREMALGEFCVELKKKTREEAKEYVVKLIIIEKKIIDYRRSE